MKRFTLLNTEYNSYNGFIFELLYSEWESWPDISLFHFYCSDEFIIIGSLGFNFTIWEK